MDPLSRPSPFISNPLPCRGGREEPYFLLFWLNYITSPTTTKQGPNSDPLSLMDPSEPHFTCTERLDPESHLILPQKRQLHPPSTSFHLLSLTYPWLLHPSATTALSTTRRRSEGSHVKKSFSSRSLLLQPPPAWVMNSSGMGFRHGNDSRLPKLRLPASRASLAASSKDEFPNVMTMRDQALSMTFLLKDGRREKVQSLTFKRRKKVENNHKVGL